MSTVNLYDFLLEDVSSCFDLSTRFQPNVRYRERISDNLAALCLLQWKCEQQNI